MSLIVCCNIWIEGSEFGVNNMKPLVISCLASMVQACACGVKMWGVFSCHTFGPLAPIKHGLTATAYLLLTMSILLWLLPAGCSAMSQSSNKAQIISNWLLNHYNELIILKWPPQSPFLNLMDHLWDVVGWEIHIMDVQSTNSKTKQLL